MVFYLPRSQFVLCMAIFSLILVAGKDLEGNSKHLRIVGGTSTTLGKYNSIGLLIYSFGGTLSPSCGCTYIGTKFAVTAAHCTESRTASNLLVRFGLVDIQSSTYDQYNVQAIYDHASYDSATFENDISLLEFTQTVTEATNVQPVSLPTQGDAVAVGTDCYIVGWGSTSEGGASSDDLMEAVVPIVSNADCQRWADEGTDGSYTVYSNQVCAGFQAGETDSCQGDSGGPLYCNAVLQGVTSFGIGCARANYPGVYTRVSDFVTWIKETQDAAISGDGVAPSTSCSEIATGATSGVIISPSYPSQYPNNAHCSWTLVAPFNNRINLRFLSFNVEASIIIHCSYDALTITESTQSTVYCGTALPNYYSTSNEVAISFTSDTTITETGFEIQWDFVSVCEEFTDSTGSITSPSYPSNYAANTACAWTVTVPSNMGIEISFSTFDIQSSNLCLSDYLTISDKSSSTSYCGRNIGTLTFASNVLYFTFLSDSSISSAGFSLTWNAVPIENVPSTTTLSTSTVERGCGTGLHTTSTGVIRSPSYPLNYPANSMCNWLIQVPDPENNKVDLTFLSFDLEYSPLCTYDYLIVADSGRRITYCGSGMPDFKSSKGDISLSFRSDGTIQGSGFSLTWEFSESGSTNLTFNSVIVIFSVLFTMHTIF